MGEVATWSRWQSARLAGRRPSGLVGYALFRVSPLQDDVPLASSHRNAKGRDFTESRTPFAAVQLLRRSLLESQEAFSLARPEKISLSHTIGTAPDWINEGTSLRIESGQPSL
jgi:hypothetical protein